MRNLFKFGAEVPWPGSNSNGFLSYKNCKSLWTLGARTTLDSKQSMELIEDIITCINVYNFSKGNYPEARKKIYESDNNGNLYYNAYCELSAYLRYLFIYYNSLISDHSLLDIKVPLIEFLKKEENNYDEIIITTYNYDIWLERLLNLNNITFNIEGFDTNTHAKIKIIKPHGSISFSFNVKISGSFGIRHDEFDGITQDISNFQVKYDLDGDFPIVNAIIPPAGDSNRTNIRWVKVIRTKLIEKLNLAVSDQDKLIIFGISYWFVDRNEIDEILTNISPFVEVFYINPSPPTCFDAVLTSLFKSYIHFKNSDLLLSSDIIQEQNITVLRT